MTTKKWWVATGNGIIRTAAQAAVGALGGSVLIEDVGWEFVASTSGLAGITYLLMRLAWPMNDPANPPDVVNAQD